MFWRLKVEKRVFVVFIFLTTLAFAQTEEDFSIIQNKSGFITITEYNRRAAKTVIIPETISGVKISEIGKDAFRFAFLLIGCYTKHTSVQNRNSFYHRNSC
jgi:hypothetical protein